MIQQNEFWDREREIRYLEEMYKSGKSELVILYGRRRIGKTCILEKFIENLGGIYFLASRTSMRENIRRFASLVSEKTGKSYIKSLQSWDEIFSAMQEIIDDRMVLVIDEFPYLIEIDKNVIYEFQRLWDTKLMKDYRFFLILCGSSVSIMEDYVLSYRSPLYGRRTGAWKVNEFSIVDFYRIFKGINLREMVKIWSVFGGVPDYIKEYERKRSFEWNIKNKILKKGSYLYNEPEILLRQEFREPRNLFLIMKSIAEGNCTPGKIQNAAGIERGNVSKYLSMLGETELVEYEKSYGRKRGGAYRIKDNFFEFWFKNVYPYMSELEIGNVEEVFKKIDFGKYFCFMFEKFVREIFQILGYSTYRYLHKGVEIDIVAESTTKKDLNAVEVKWGSATHWDAERLLKKAENISSPAGYRKTHTLVCSNYKGRDVENVEILTLRSIEGILNGFQSSYPSFLESF